MTYRLKNLPTLNVINLKECTDRKELTESEFKRLGVDNYKIHVYDRYEEGVSIPFEGDPDLISKCTKGVTSSHLLTIKWWYENTDEEYGIFLEDDVDFTPLEHWNFTLSEYIERCNDYDWGALQLGLVFEYPYDVWHEYPPMFPRRRTEWDHGLQVYVLKRKYAEILLEYYFGAFPGKLHFRMPLGSANAFENNVLCGFGDVITFPLFNHNVTDFRSKNIYCYNEQTPSAIYSYEYLTDWWDKKGSQKSLDDIFGDAKL